MKLLIYTQAVDKKDPILGFFHQWIEEFARHFEHVYVVCLKLGEHTLPGNVSVYSLGKETKENRLKYVFRFFKFSTSIFLRGRIEYVFFHMGAVYNILLAPIFFIRKLTGTRFYWWKTHGHINLTGRVASLFVDRIYTASPESFPIRTSKRYVVGHGISLPAYPPIRQRFSEPYVFLCVGRISRIKNTQVAVELARILFSKGVPFSLKIIGKTVDRDYQNELEELVRRYNLGAYVTFEGPHTHETLQQLYARAHFLIHPSETGSIDKVVLEAAAAGVIPVCLERAYGGILGDFGFCVSSNDPEQYYHTLVRAMSMEEGEYNEVRARLYEKVRAEHSLATLYSRIFQPTP